MTAYDKCLVEMRSRYALSHKGFTSLSLIMNHYLAWFYWSLSASCTAEKIAKSECLPNDPKMAGVLGICNVLPHLSSNTVDKTS